MAHKKQKKTTKKSTTPKESPREPAFGLSTRVQD